METKCRVCLCGDRRLHAISNSGFQKIWEILTKTKFNVNDGRPPNVCYICYAQLRNTHQLMQRSRKAEELITVVVDSCIPEKSQQVILKISGESYQFDYSYGVKKAYQLEHKQFERNLMKEINKETKEVSKEKNKRNNDINIKETEEDIICQAETRNNVDKSGRFLVDKLPEKELRIVLDKIDMGTHMRKRTLNEVPQKAKRIKFGQRTEDRNPESDTSCFSEPLPEEWNMIISEIKQVINTQVDDYPINKISPKVKLLPKKNQARNVTVQSNKTLNSNGVTDNNAGNEFWLPKTTKTAAPSTSSGTRKEGALVRKCILNEVPQKANRTNLDKVTENINAASGTSCSEEISEDWNEVFSKMKQIIQTLVNRYQIDKTNVNIRPEKVQAKNVTEQSNETLNSNGAKDNNARNEFCLPKSTETAAPNASSGTRAPMKKYIFYKGSQKAKRINLDQTTKDQNPTSDTSCSEHLSDDWNMMFSKIKQVIETLVNHYVVDKISPKV